MKAKPALIQQLSPQECLSSIFTLTDAFLSIAKMPGFSGRSVHRNGLEHLEHLREGVQILWLLFDFKDRQKPWRFISRVMEDGTATLELTDIKISMRRDELCRIIADSRNLIITTQKWFETGVCHIPYDERTRITLDQVTGFLDSIITKHSVEATPSFRSVASLNTIKSLLVGASPEPSPPRSA